MLSRVADVSPSAVAGITFRYILTVVEAGEVQQVFTQSAGGTKAFEFNSSHMLTAYGKLNGRPVLGRVVLFG
jgi:hypothetical protein